MALIDLCLQPRVLGPGLEAAVVQGQRLRVGVRVRVRIRARVRVRVSASGLASSSTTKARHPRPHSPAEIWVRVRDLVRL